MTTAHDNKPRALLAGYIASVIVAVGAFSDLTDVRDQYGWPAIVGLALGVAGFGLLLAPAGKLPPLIDPHRRAVGAASMAVAVLFGIGALSGSGGTTVKEPIIDITDCGSDWNGTTSTKWNTGGHIYNPNRYSIRVSFQAALRFPNGVLPVVSIVRTVPPLATARYDVGTPHSPNAPLPPHPLLSEAGGTCATVALQVTAVPF